MRRIIAVTLLLVTFPHAAAQESQNLQISELLPNPGEGREFIEIWNPTNEEIALHEWRVEDAAGNSFSLVGHTLPAGKRIVVWGGGEPTAEGPAWSKATVWNNAGDTATLWHGEVLVHSLTYGSGGEPVPDAGQSLALVDGDWQHDEPTPGRAPGEVGGSATATVANIAPTVRFIDAPSTVPSGETFTVSFELSDANGDALTWSLTADQGLVAEGATSGSFAKQITAPNDGIIVVQLSATDEFGNTNQTQTSITVEATGISVIMPPGGIQFPELVPGATNVTATAAFEIRNDGSTATPRIDISDFGGPEVIPVAGNLSIGIGANLEQEWIAYTGPLTALPSLPSGASYQVWLRLDHVPLPLAAGAYGTSFTVIA